MHEKWFSNLFVKFRKHKQEKTGPEQTRKQGDGK